MKKVAWIIIMLISASDLFGTIFFDSINTYPLFHEKQPIDIFFDQSLNTKQLSGISRLGVGYNLELDKTDLENPHYSHNLYTIKAANLFVGYKFYDRNPNQSYPFIDFTLYENSYNGRASIFSLMYNCSILSKQTYMYSRNDITWAKFGVGFGWTFSGRDIPIFTVTLTGNLIYRTFTPDTIICQRLPENLKGTNNQFFNGGMKFIIEKAPFTFSAEAISGISSKAWTDNLSIKASYKFRSNNIENDYERNRAEIYLSFNSELLYTQVTKDSKTHYDYKAEYEMIKLGFTTKLGKL